MESARGKSVSEGEEDHAEAFTAGESYEVAGFSFSRVSQETRQTLAVSLFVVVGAWGLGVVVALSCFCFLFCKCFGIPNSPRILDLDDRQGLIASSAMQ